MAPSSQLMDRERAGKGGTGGSLVMTARRGYDAEEEVKPRGGPQEQKASFFLPEKEKKKKNRKLYMRIEENT